MDESIKSAEDERIKNAVHQFVIKTRSVEVGGFFDVSKAARGMQGNHRIRLSPDIMRDIADIPDAIFTENEVRRLTYLIGEVVRGRRRLNKDAQSLQDDYEAETLLGSGKKRAHRLYPSYEMKVLIKKDEEGEYLEVHKLREYLLQKASQGEGRGV